MSKKIDKWPPYLNANKAFGVIEQIYTNFGKAVNIELLPKFLDTSRKSSYFSKRLAALQTFGLGIIQDEILTLSPLALAIVTPVNMKEKRAAKIETLNNVEILKILRNKFPNENLPDKVHLRNILLREFDVPNESVDEWVRFIVESINSIKPTVSELLDEPAESRDIIQPPKSAPQPTIDKMNRNIEEESMLRVPLFGDRYILIPKDFSANEAHYFSQWFEMWKGLQKNEEK
jgi:hypothetical protein